MNVDPDLLERYRTLVAAEFAALHGSGFGQPFYFDEPDLSPDERSLAVTASVLDDLGGRGRTEIWMVDLGAGDARRVSTGATSARLPRWSPCGRWLAYLRAENVNGERVVVAPVQNLGEACSTASAPGTVEYFHWSPDSSALLLAVAAPGAELSGMQGARRSPVADDLPAWIPDTTTDARAALWRSLWLADIGGAMVRRASPEGITVWEAAWCGADRIAAVVSDDPAETGWYTARIDTWTRDVREVRTLARPERQVGSLQGDCSGRRLAFVEAFASDRLVVAGRIQIVDLASGQTRTLCPLGVDVTSVRFRSAGRLVFAGHRDFATVVGDVDAVSGEARCALESERSHSGFWAPVAIPKGDAEYVVLIEHFTSSSVVTVLGPTGMREIARPSHPGIGHPASVVSRVQALRWHAPDGLEIHGWLIEPKAAAPYPIATEIHGGPVWMNRNSWIGNMPLLMCLLKVGYAVFLPNPRGSWGRGDDFMRRVVGDMGGADTHDYLSGFDALVSRGLADPRRICVTGSSYGGFMSAWLVTQDARFAASVARCPVTDWHSQHRISNIPHFDELFLGGLAREAGARHFERSPALFAGRVRTPTLLLCGKLDRCSPPGQARMMFSALREAGVPTGLVTYPNEGHGLRAFPVRIDVTSRILAWFDRGAGIERALDL